MIVNRLEATLKQLKDGKITIEDLLIQINSICLVAVNIDAGINAGVTAALIA